MMNNNLLLINLYANLIKYYSNLSYKTKKNRLNQQIDHLFQKRILSNINQKLIAFFKKTYLMEIQDLHQNLFYFMQSKKIFILTAFISN